MFLFCFKDSFIKKERICFFMAKILLNKEKIIFVKNSAVDFNTEQGMIKSTEFKNKSGLAKTSKGKKIKFIEAFFIDLYHRKKRGPQIITLKDIGQIIAEAGLGKNSRVLDAGGGSGALSCFLANICKEVYSYEVRKDFFKLVEENKKFLGLNNLTVRNKDVYTGIEEKELNAVILDVPEPWQALKHTEKALKLGGFLVSYQTSLVQVQRLFKEIKKKPFIFVKTCETLQRNWKIEGRVVRPEIRMLGHTGWLSFFRKV